LISADYEGVFKVAFYLKNNFFSQNNQALSCIILTSMRTVLLSNTELLQMNCSSEVMLRSVNGPSSSTTVQDTHFSSTSEHSTEVFTTCFMHI